MAEQVGIGSGEDIDRLRSLPDDVIFHILSYLHRHEAIRLTLLSRRWRSLFAWTAFLTLDYGSSILRDHWVCYPPLPCVQELEIRLRGHSQFNHLHSASFLFNCNTLVRLKLKLCQYFTLVVPDTVNLPKLRVLHLEQIKFSDDESIQRIFSGCCVLEELVVKGWKLGHTRQFSVSSPTLKILILRSLICSYPNQELVIYAPSIDYFEHLDFGPTSPRVKLRGISNIQSRYLSNNRVMRAFGLYRNDAFPSLTYLDITNPCFYYDWTDILRSSPCLETIVIKLELPPFPDYWRVVLPYRLSSYGLSKLKSIEFLSFRGKKYELQLVEYFLNKAPYLQNLAVHVSERERLRPGVTEALTELAKVSKKCNIIIVSDILSLF
ncbi:hypothetical protein PTKIN_Ptkin14bG0055700 [Pterospermum kingtungense]